MLPTYADQIDGVLQIAALDEVCRPLLLDHFFQTIEFSEDGNSGDFFVRTSLRIQNCHRLERRLFVVETSDEPLRFSIRSDDEEWISRGISPENSPLPLVECEVPNEGKDEAEGSRVHEQQSAEELPEEEVVAKREEREPHDACEEHVTDIALVGLDSR